MDENKKLKFCFWVPFTSLGLWCLVICKKKPSNIYIITVYSFLKGIFLRNSLKNNIKIKWYHKWAFCAQIKETSIFCTFRPLVWKQIALQYSKSIPIFIQWQGSLGSEFGNQYQSLFSDKDHWGQNSEINTNLYSVTRIIGVRIQKDPSHWNHSIWLQQP